MSLLHLSGFTGTAEVMGLVRNVSFTEASGLTIAGLTLADAHAVLNRLHTGTLAGFRVQPDGNVRREGIDHQHIGEKLGAEGYKKPDGPLAELGKNGPPLTPQQALAFGRALQPLVGDQGAPPEGAPAWGSLTGKHCSVCGEPQITSAGGDTCGQGHGGADALEDAVPDPPEKAPTTSPVAASPPAEAPAKPPTTRKPRAPKAAPTGPEVDAAVKAADASSTPPASTPEEPKPAKKEPRELPPSLEARGFSLTGDKCYKCELPSYSLPLGPMCENGHVGGPGLEGLPAAPAVSVAEHAAKVADDTEKARAAATAVILADGQKDPWEMGVPLAGVTAEQIEALVAEASKPACARFFDVVALIVDRGIKDAGVIAAICETIRDRVPALKKVANIADRVARTLEGMDLS